MDYLCYLHKGAFCERQSTCQFCKYHLDVYRSENKFLVLASVTYTVPQRITHHLLHTTALNIFSLRLLISLVWFVSWKYLDILLPRCSSGRYV